jgi:hypothetical protein
MAKITHQDVLDAIPVPKRFTYDRDTMMMYKLGVMSAWIARLAQQDITVLQELRERANRRWPGDSVRTVRTGE